jgi:NADH-quinone oxidoreductase subunit M
VFLGPEYKGPHPEAITPITWNEALIGSVLLALCIVMGVFPNLVFHQMDSAITLLVDQMYSAKSLGTAAVTTLLGR